MSWDILIQDLPDVASVEDVPDDFRPKKLGSRAEVAGRISSSLPDTDFSDPSWGTLERAGWSIEFNVGQAEPCEGVMLHVRGTGADAPHVVQQVIEALDARGIDMQTSELFSAERAQESFSEWQNYRDSVVQQYDANERPRRKGLFKRLFRYS